MPKKLTPVKTFQHLQNVGMLRGNKNTIKTFLMAECIFCKIVKREIKAEIVYENKDILAFLDILPRSPGHTLVIPKVHTATLLELPDQYLKPFFGGVKKVVSMVAGALKPDGFTLGINHGKASGQEVLHLHFHIIPRWYDDGGRPIQGVVENPPKESLEKIAEKIRISKNL